MKSLGEVSQQLNHHIGSADKSASSVFLHQVLDKEEEEILYVDQNNQIIEPVEDELPCFISKKKDLTLTGLDTTSSSFITTNISSLEEGPEGLQQQTNELEIEQGVEVPTNKHLGGSLGPQYRKRQSKVWTFFEKSAKGDHVVCNSCGEVQRFMSNTTNMIRHIKRAHSGQSNISPLPVGRQLRRKAVPRSAVWAYFSRVPGEPRVQCGICKEIYSYSGNTTNLRFHLKTKHPDIQEKMEEVNIVTQEGVGTGPMNEERLQVEERMEEVETISVEVLGEEDGLGASVYVASTPVSYMG